MNIIRMIVGAFFFVMTGLFGAQIILWEEGLVVAPFTTSAEIKSGRCPDTGGEDEGPCGHLSGAARKMCEDAEKRDARMAQFRQNPAAIVTHGLETETPVAEAAEIAQIAPALIPVVCTKPDADWSVCAEKPRNLSIQGDCEWHVNRDKCPVHNTAWGWMKTRRQLAFNGIGQPPATDRGESAAASPTRENYIETSGCRFIETKRVRFGDYLAKFTENLPKFQRFRVRGSSLACSKACNEWAPDEKDGDAIAFGRKIHICGLR